MSVSIPGGERNPSAVTTGKTTSGGRPGGKATGSGGGKPGGGRPGGKGRKPVAPVRVGQGTNWGPIGLIAAVVVLVAGIIGYGVYAVVTSKAGDPWQERAAAIKGIVNYGAKDPNLVKAAQHAAGPLKYNILPPVGGPHNGVPQNCMGDVYDAPIANEHAVHSLEHGAVWITYRPDLPQNQIDTLVSKVKGKEKTMISPYPGLDKPISLQAWGYQLKVDKADDPRIDEFIKVLRVNASAEGPTAACSGGITATGTTPRDATARPTG